MESVKRIEVRSLLSPVVLVSPASQISKVVGVLKESNAYEAFMEDKGKIGMITTRDILKVSNITTTKASSLALFLPRISPRSTISEAARLMMEYRIRALPIVENNEIIGEVRALSIICAIKESDFSKIIAQDIMTANPVTLSRDDLASKARGLMIRRKIDHIPVLAGNKLCGILTSSHLVFSMAHTTETIKRSTTISEERRKLEFPVRYAMDSNPLICETNENIFLILDAMIKQGTTYSIVALPEEVQGIITYRDYMKLISEQLKVSDAPIYIVGLPEDPLEAEIIKSKFTNAVNQLLKRFPFIEESKAVIKTFSEGVKERRRYEVSVSIITPKKTFSYSEKGWDLLKIFDAVTDKLKRAILQKRPRRVTTKDEK